MGAQGTSTSLGEAGVRLFALSFLILFVELALIRWTTARIIYLSYFTNFVLLGSFLGIGLGFIKRYQGLFRLAPLAIGTVVALVYFFPTRIAHSAGGRLLYFGNHTGGTPIWLALPIIFVSVAATLMTLSEEAARWFTTLPPLSAYRLDLLGSLAGTAVFSLFAYLQSPPLVWGVVIGVVLLVLYGRSLRLLQLVGLVLLLVPVALDYAHAGLTWSPYYAVQVVKIAPQTYRIDVNGVPHQVTEPVAEVGSFYRAPYRHLTRKPLRNVLIIGAGNGVDVALALAHGAEHVDAVEIDPHLIAIGRTLDPNRPYESPRVSVHIADGRQFLESTKHRYDLILFALPDSLTLVSNQSSLRLESYLFTLQAFQAARAHLTSYGVFAMYNFYRQGWLVDRFGRSLTHVFGHPPCLDELLAVGGAAAGPVADLTVGVTPQATNCSTVWEATRAPAPATDDHPFPYLESPSLPPLYLWTLALILGASALSVRVVIGALRPMKAYLDLFAMGAAFLLLETKGVVQFALFFGTTWLVNSLVFIGVLLAVLLAVEVTARLEIKRFLPLYGTLLVALLVAYLVNPAALLALSFWPRLLAASTLYFTPIFLANVIFARRFRETHEPTLAFGTNLLGAIVGGTLEYTSLLIGYRALIIIVAVLYLAALIAGRRRISSA
jgi:spermine/spermidine synthase